MKKLKRWFKDFFEPDTFNDLDTGAIGEALNDSMIRTVWLNSCFAELKRINMDVDKHLLSGNDLGLLDLCARRKAYQDVLEGILTAKRIVTKGTQEVRHNPPPGVFVNLDRVTA